jgi:hypothetical protein
LDSYAQTWGLRRQLRIFDEADNVGAYILVMWAFLLWLLLAVSFDGYLLPQYARPFWRMGLGVLAAALAADILTVNSAIAFVSRGPAHPLRSAIFGVSALAQLGTVFAVFYACLREGLCRPVLPVFDVLYFSFVTMATVGYGDLRPADYGGLADLLKLVVIAQLLISIFFAGVILTTVVQWANETPWARRAPTPWPADDDTGGA